MTPHSEVGIMANTTRTVILPPTEGRRENLKILGAPPASVTLAFMTDPPLAFGSRRMTPYSEVGIMANTTRTVILPPTDGRRENLKTRPPLPALVA